MKTSIVTLATGLLSGPGKLFLVLLLCWSPLQARAATRTWTGGSPFGANWRDAANWAGNAPPGPGDDLVFPGTAVQRENTNDFPNTIFHSIYLSGRDYVIRGNALGLQDGILAIYGNNRFYTDIRLVLSQSFVNTRAGETLFIHGDVDLNGSTLEVSGSGDVTMSGAIRAVAGVNYLVKTGTNTLRLIGLTANSNFFTRVESGVVELNKGFLVPVAAIPSYLGIENPDLGDTTLAVVRLMASHQIADTAYVEIGRLGLLDLNNHSDTIGNLGMSGGVVQTGTGTLTLGTINPLIGISASAGPPAISGNLCLGGLTRTWAVTNGPAAVDLYLFAAISDGGGGAGTTFIESGTVSLDGANTYDGPTTVSGGTVLVRNNSALGSTVGGTVVHAPSRLGLALVGVAVGNEALTLWSTNGLYAIASSSWAGPITLNSDVAVEVTSGVLDLQGRLSGSRSFAKTGAGTVLFSGVTANTYTGDTLVHEGTLRLGKSDTLAVQFGALIIGDGLGGANADVVSLEGDDQIANTVPITLNSSGRLDLDGHNEQVGPLTFNGGTLDTDGGPMGPGLLTLGADVTVNPSSAAMALLTGRAALPATRTVNVTGHDQSPDLRIDAVLSGSGGLRKTGPGELALRGTNSFTGPVSVEEGVLLVENGLALGATATGTVVSAGATLHIRGGQQVGNEPLALNGTGYSRQGALRASSGSNSWAGRVTLESATLVHVAGASDYLNLRGRVGGPGGLTKSGAGTLLLTGTEANDYAGLTRVDASTLVLGKSASVMAVPGELRIGEGTGPAGSVVARWAANHQVSDAAAVIVGQAGLLDLNGARETIGSLSGSGLVDLGAGQLVVGANDASTEFSGAISGAGGRLYKVGAGTFTLTGNNTYTGPTYVNEGTLLVNGLQPASPVEVNPGGTLGGAGTVGHLTVSGGTVAPGTSVGTLLCSNVSFNAASTFRVELNGTHAGIGYDQLNVRGTVNLGGAALEVVLGFTPVEGNQFVILANDGTDAVTGTFAGLTNGATFTVGLVEFRIRYDAGTGNDVGLTVTRVLPPLQITSVALVGTNLALTWAGGLPPYVVEKATALSTNITWQAVTGPLNVTNVAVPRDAANGFYRIRGGP